MRVVTLGTGSPIPHPDRAGPATLVTTDGTRVLCDCGRAVVMRLAGCGVLPVQLDAVLLTHLHSDHICDLNDVITTHWVMTGEPTPLRVVGPPGTAEVVDATLAMLALDRRWRLAHHEDLSWDPVVEVAEVAGGDVLEVGGLTVRVADTDHRPVTPTVGYRVEDGDGSVALAGDTVPCPGLDDLCRGADVYVQTVIRDDLVRALPNRRIQDILDYHSTVEQAARTAQRGGVGTLVLTHMVPPPAPGTVEEWRERAAAHFDGRVIVAEDLTTVEV